MIVYAKDFGAIADGKTLSSANIQQAIDFCESEGGGKVIFESAVYLIGSLYMRNNVFLELPADAFFRHPPILPTITNLMPGVKMSPASTRWNILQEAIS